MTFRHRVGACRHVVEGRRRRSRVRRQDEVGRRIGNVGYEGKGAIAPDRIFDNRDGAGRRVVNNGNASPNADCNHAVRMQARFAIGQSHHIVRNNATRINSPSTPHVRQLCVQKRRLRDRLGIATLMSGGAPVSGSCKVAMPAEVWAVDQEPISRASPF